jgi:hypothetical protein
MAGPGGRNTTTLGHVATCPDSRLDRFRGGAFVRGLSSLPLSDDSIPATSSEDGGSARPWSDVTPSREDLAQLFTMRAKVNEAARMFS